MDFLPVIIYALTLGAGTPSTTVMVNEVGDELYLDMPQTLLVNFDVEAQFAEFAFLGGSWKSSSGTEYNNGFQPLQADYSVYGGVTFELGKIVVTASIEHTCLHPQASYLGKTVAWGVYSATNELTVKFSSGEFVNR